MVMRMMRTRQVVLICLFGLLSTVLFLSLRMTTRENYLVSEATKDRIDTIIANSKRFSQERRKSLSQTPGNKLLDIANRISKYNRTVLVTMVNDAYLKFTYSWLCNTKNMNIHKSVLVITTDQVSMENLTRDWPEISVVSMDMQTSKGDQTYSQVGYVRIMIKRTEMLLSLLMANIEIFLFEVDCLWFANPIPGFQRSMGYDILVNPVAGTDHVYAGGFLWLYRTERAKSLWAKLTEDMVALGERIRKMSDKTAVSEMENDQQFFSRLINTRYANVTIKVLPLDIYADGKWYALSEEKRKASHPIVVNNNWVLGNKAKIERAKKWKHWFIHDDLTCDMDLVAETVY